MPAERRPRAAYVAAALGSIAIGLLVHRAGGVLPRAVRDVCGDALWAVMMFWWVGALAPRLALIIRASLALTICYGVEFSQLYQAPGLDALRATTVGHLVLGSDFDARDLASYALGVLTAVLIERAVRSSNRRASTVS